LPVSAKENSRHFFKRETPAVKVSANPASFFKQAEAPLADRQVNVGVLFHRQVDPRDQVAVWAHVTDFMHDQSVQN
jgi:hypothetical protein